MAQENVLFEGKRLTLVTKPLVISNGKSFNMEIVKVKSAVAIVALSGNYSVLLVEQVRPATGTDSPIYEIPAGLIEDGESPLDCAKRELLEETGYVSDNWSAACRCFTSPGFTNEMIYGFFAQDVRFEGLKREESEKDMKSTFFDISNVIEMMENGLIVDMKTLFLINKLVSTVLCD